MIHVIYSLVRYWFKPRHLSDIPQFSKLHVLRKMLEGQ